MRLKILVPCFLSFVSCTLAQPLNHKQKFTRQDTLRGSITPERIWWDVLRYDITVIPDYNTKSISGKNVSTYKVLQEKHSPYIQIDLQRPLNVDTIYYNNKLYINYPGKPYYNSGNVWMIPLPKAKQGSVNSITVVYSGKPREAVRPPWDGGWIWTKDEKSRPWMTVACQGLGASVWYPCKDHQSDEPDNGASITVVVPDSLVAVANGRLKNKTVENGSAIYTWEVKNPINNYNIVPYIGKYVNWTETFEGEKGNLNCSYWVLDYDLDKAKKQFQQVKPTLKAFEYWFGPYPFYEDDYKLVESSHLGMEHQSAVAYGNKFQNGYLGRDLSGTGHGLKWDFIIVHETAHEWWGNNITTKDIADMWVHEGFGNYSETLFVEYNYNKQAANEYVQGIREGIQNDKPIIGVYGVNQEGSGDMYPKGANTLHTVRQVINDDVKFRNILRGLQKNFYHQTVTSKQVENYISKQSGKDLSKIFDQYLRTTKIPILEIKGNSYRWSNTIAGFNMPVRLTSGEWIFPTAQWKKLASKSNIEVDKNFYVQVKKI
ncbi:MAG: M1 family metallopeptidase [Chitinophagaceae bacterium]|nr:M1 family metallopeptidase [Chitinophagaceae bacterium]